VWGLPIERHLPTTVRRGQLSPIVMRRPKRKKIAAGRFYGCSFSTRSSYNDHSWELAFFIGCPKEFEGFGNFGPVRALRVQGRRIFPNAIPGHDERRRLPLELKRGMQRPSVHKCPSTNHHSLLTIKCGHLISTVTPLVTAFSTSTASQFASRIQPWLAERPIESGLLVP